MFILDLGRERVVEAGNKFVFVTMHLFLVGWIRLISRYRELVRTKEEENKKCSRSSKLDHLVTSVEKLPA